MSKKEKTMDEVFFQEESIKVEIGVKEEEKKVFEVTTLVRKQYTSIIQLAATLAINLEEDVLDNIEEHIGVITHLISDELLLKIYGVVTSEDKEWINNNMTMSQEINLLTAIFKTNDIKELVQNFTTALTLVKSLIRRTKNKK
jgi:hypothetical protein